MIGGRKIRSNKGTKRGSYGPRTGKTRSGKIFRVKTLKVGRKTRSNKGKKRQPYGSRTGKTRSGKRFRGGGVSKCVKDEDSVSSDERCSGMVYDDCDDSNDCEWGKCVYRSSNDGGETCENSDQKVCRDTDGCEWDPRQ